MRVVLDIKDNKVDYILELLQKFSFVKVKAMKRPKSELIEEIKQSVEEINLYRAGKIKLKSAEEFLDELQGYFDPRPSLRA